MHSTGRALYGRLTTYGARSLLYGASRCLTTAGARRELQGCAEGRRFPRENGPAIFNQNHFHPALHTRPYTTSHGHTHSHPHKPSKDLYAIIGVSPNATHQQIKDHYYQLSMKYHPDRNKGSQEAHQKFTELTEAYSILGQHDLRRKYDKGLLQGYPRKPHVHHKKEHHAAATTVAGQKKIYDFDEFYRAHYGEVLRWQRRQTAEKKAAAAEEAKLQTFSLPMHRSLIILVTMSVMVVGWAGARYRERQEREGRLV